MFPDRCGYCSLRLTAHLCHDNKAIHNPGCQTILYYGLSCSTFFSPQCCILNNFPISCALVPSLISLFNADTRWVFKGLKWSIILKKQKTKTLLFIAACIWFCLWIKQSFLWVNCFFMRFHRAVESCLHMHVTHTLISWCSSYFLLRFKWMQLSHLLR